jgi:long-chain fatty acid transport protein
MRRRGALIWKALGTVALAATVAVAPARPIFAAGFSIFEQSAKATGMADAVTAQWDDPSTIFFNVGGMAFYDKAAGSVGATYITETHATFSGANPYPGEGVNASQKRLQAFPPHAYWVQPLTPELKVGLGIETPFGLTTQWNNPDTFAGRYLSTKAELHAFDINPSVAWQVNPHFGIGIGFIARVSNVELDRYIPAEDPFNFTVVNAAKVDLKGDYNAGYGGDIGLMYRTDQWSVGASYRSQINVNYTGNAVLTQTPTGNPILDGIIGASLPFNTPIPAKTEIKYPAQASLGIAFKPMSSLTLEVDGNYFGWSHFDTVPIDFPGGQLPSSTIIERWKDSYAVRAGLEWASSAMWKWRLGYVYDQSPQPTETVNPLLPDANRNGVTAGLGWSGAKLSADLGVMYLFFADRTRNVTFSDDPLGPFYGTYRTNALLVSVTLGFHQ